MKISTLSATVAEEISDTTNETVYFVTLRFGDHEIFTWRVEDPDSRWYPWNEAHRQEAMEQFVAEKLGALFTDQVANQEKT